ncbi:fas apoptotic inhibitory molecule 1 [Onthophagus taurus]|uniref:fas apoptotic inhibitory molecule 1 n=1 Tax=Onthophagus taurus TaxID=166361 RepID=UPI000C20A958|nr:fas apoptotic inhibitory molecule 1 [Onthophagus taurus]
MSLLKKNSEERTDLVAYWSVPLYDGVHTIEFDHGTTSGKRVLRVDGQELFRRDWMFKLVGDEKFTIGTNNTLCEIKVDPLPNFSFGYSLYINGEPLEKFVEKQNRSLKSWAVVSNGKRFRIVFEKSTLNVWINGEQIETENDFTELGTEMKFLLDDQDAFIKATTTDKKEGVIHNLYIKGKLIDVDY